MDTAIKELLTQAIDAQQWQQDKWQELWDKVSPKAKKGGYQSLRFNAAYTLTLETPTGELIINKRTLEHGLHLYFAEFQRTGSLIRTLIDYNQIQPLLEVWQSN